MGTGWKAREDREVGREKGERGSGKGEGRKGRWEGRREKGVGGGRHTLMSVIQQSGRYSFTVSSSTCSLTGR